MTGPTAGTSTRRGSVAARLVGLVTGLALLLLAMPASAAAHALTAAFESRLPLAVYLAGAAAAVGLSFLFVLVRDIRSEPPADDGRRRRVPAVVRGALRAVGLLAWAWIMAQGIVGGESMAEVSRLFAWVYGWVGIALVSAFAFPIWTWLSPFGTLHDLGARALRAVGIQPLEPAEYPERLGRWPAVAGFAAIVWLELVASGASSQTLALVIAGYTIYTLAMMAQYGRRTWLEHGEVFAVWFGLLNRLAPFAPGDPEDDALVRRRPVAGGLLEGGWRTEDIVLIGLGTGSILFDGLAQTQAWVSLVGLPATLPQTLLLGAFLGAIVGAALVVARFVGTSATAAGLLPIAVGYLLAHYFTFLVIDGQRIVIAISDPLQQGANYFGTAFFEPTGLWLPPSLVWTLQLAAVVGGHMVGAWAGHVVASGAAGRQGTLAGREIRLRQVPLAIVMVGLTTLTLWSLGQALFIPTS